MLDESQSEPTETRRDRLLRYAQPTDPTLVVEALRAERGRVLERWLAAVGSQPFHLGRPRRAVSDEIPALFDALVDGLEQTADTPALVPADRVKEAAAGHARTRTAQGLLPGEIVLEFRILRQEILHALRERLSDSENISDLLGTELLMGDAIDGAVAIAVDYFVAMLEEMKDDFVTVAAHDLRNPLTALKAALQFLRRRSAAGGLTPEMLLEALESAEQGAARMEQLLSNLLDIAQVRAGRLEIQPEPTDLRAVVERVLRRLSPGTVERVQIEDDGSALIGLWEPSRIEQVVENLLTNAAKYAPEGPILVRLARNDGVALLQVVDQGIGLSAEDRAQLFRRFYRSPEVIERKLTGTGLGLYICRGIVDAHGGEIAIESPGRGRGTTATVLLPLAGEAPSP